MKLTGFRDIDDADYSLSIAIHNIFDLLLSSTDPLGILGNLAIHLGFVEQQSVLRDGDFALCSQEATRLLSLLHEEYKSQEDWLSQWWYPVVFKDLTGLIFECVIPKLGGGVDYERDWQLLCWFWQAPVVDLLRSVSIYLEISKSEETFSRSRYSEVVVVSVSYEVAATILERRLCTETGLEHVVSWIQQDVQQTHAQEERINILTKLPETCSALRAEHLLHHSNFVPLVTSHLIGQISSNPSDSRLLHMCSAIVDKFSCRGFSRWVVQALLDAYLSGHGVLVSKILHSFPETGEGMKRVSSELLYQISGLQDRGDAAQKALIMKDVISKEVWNGNVGVRLQLGDILLTKGKLWESSLEVLLHYLHCISPDEDDGSPILLALERVVTVWSASSSPNALSPHQQKIQANFIIGCLSILSGKVLERKVSLIPHILKGISIYLENPREPMRHIGMCVGNALSSTLTPERPLIFSEDGIESSISLQRTAMKERDQDPIPEKLVVVEEKDFNDSEIDSDDDTVDSEFGSQQDLDDGDHDDSAMKLEEMVRMLRNGENNWKDQLAAIASAEDVIRASPCELSLYSKDITQALLYARIPAWANEEREKDGAKPVEEQRLDALIALVLEEPRNVGSFLIDAFYSPSSDVQHRVRSLQLLTSGARTLQSEQPRIEARSKRAAGGQYRWAGQTGHILLEWSRKLLIQCDKRQHGIDLFGRDTHLLGCLICTLGNFVDVCSGSQEALYLGTAILRLLSSDSVRNSKEIFVRRSALAAGAQSIASVPASSVATAFAENLIGASDDTRFESGSVTSRDFLKLVHETNTWFKSASENDMDPTCKKLAAGGITFIGNLAMDALEEYSRAHSQDVTTLEWKGDLRLKELTSGDKLLMETVKIPKFSEIGI